MYPSQVLSIGVISEKIAALKLRLLKVENQLKEVRGATPLTHGWQTSKLAKAQRKWDVLAEEKRQILAEIDALENKASDQVLDLQMFTKNFFAR
jgi:hypothetical protein